MVVVPESDDSSSSTRDSRSSTGVSRSSTRPLSLSAAALALVGVVLDGLQPRVELRDVVGGRQLVDARLEVVDASVQLALHPAELAGGLVWSALSSLFASIRANTPSAVAATAQTAATASQRRRLRMSASVAGRSSST